MQTQKAHPRFPGASEQTKEIGGLPITVRRLPARLAPSFLLRLLTDLGPIVTELLADPGKELDPTIEGAIRHLLTGVVGLEAGLTASVGIIKSLILSQAIVRAKDFDIDYYVETLLVENIDIDGVRIGSMDDLDATEIPPRTLLEVIWYACEVNYRPTLAGDNTSDGSRRPAPSQPRQKATITGRSSLRGDANAAGRVVRT